MNVKTKTSNIAGDHVLPDTPAKLIDVGEVAELLGCSQRHVYRLADSGRMPRPVKLGTLVRWNQRVVDQWIGDGCPHAEKVH